MSQVNKASQTNKMSQNQGRQRRHTDEFDVLLEGVLRETANPALPPGFAKRMTEADVVASNDVWAAKELRDREDAMAEMGVLADGRMRRIGVFGSIFGSIWESVRELGSYRRTEPLLLGFGPITGPDPVAERRSLGPFGWALAAHGVAILLIGLSLAGRRSAFTPVEALLIPMVEAPAPIKMLPRAHTSGGGGGQQGPTPVARGRLPKIAETQVVPPQAPPLTPPKIAVEPTVVMQRDLKMADNRMPNLGMPNSTIVGTGSLGNGSGTGIGSGNGAGGGAGSGGNTGGGVMRIGGGISAPVPLSMPDPEFSEEARKAKLSGNVLVYLWVDALGRPTHVRILRGIGMGLDEKALAAVRQYRFKPALRNGQPVTVEMNVEVNFQIF